MDVLSKKKISEIIDSNGELIGSKDVPEYGSDLETSAKKTTDHNIITGNQPFTYDTLAKFGFPFLPFFENVEDEENSLFNKLLYTIKDFRLSLIQSYYKNPNKIKYDYRNITNGNYDMSKEDYIWSEKIFNEIKNIVDVPENLDEEKDIVEEFLDDMKNNNEFINKTNSNEIIDNKLTKIAGLINKLDKENVDKLINLLENR
jgi:hypothetical protein